MVTTVGEIREIMQVLSENKALKELIDVINEFTGEQRKLAIEMAIELLKKEA